MRHRRTSYLQALYKYPQAEFPYAQLVDENRRRSRCEPEFELVDTGVFDDDRYFDVLAEYAKASPDDLLIRITVANRGPEPAPLHVLPTLWFRNTWAWGCAGEDYCGKAAASSARRTDASLLRARVAWRISASSWTGTATPPPLLFTENETNVERLFGMTIAVTLREGCVSRVSHRRPEPTAVNPERVGTKAAAHYPLEIGPARAAGQY